MNQQKFDSLVSAHEYLKNFTPVLQTYCEHFELGQEVNINDFVTGLEGFAKVLEILLITAEHHPIQINLSAIEDALRQVTDALTGGANALVSDIITANILPLLSEWERELDLILTTQEPDLLS